MDREINQNLYMFYLTTCLTLVLENFLTLPLFYNLKVSIYLARCIIDSTLHLRLDFFYLMRLHKTSLVDTIIRDCLTREPHGLHRTPLNIRCCHHQKYYVHLPPYHQDYLQITLPTSTKLYEKYQWNVSFVQTSLVAWHI